MDKDEQAYDTNTDAFCGRCIQDWFEDDKCHRGTKVPADCEECGVCSECEHWNDCSKAN